MAAVQCIVSSILTPGRHFENPVDVDGVECYAVRMPTAEMVRSGAAVDAWPVLYVPVHRMSGIVSDYVPDAEGEFDEDGNLISEPDAVGRVDSYDGDKIDGVPVDGSRLMSCFGEFGVVTLDSKDMLRFRDFEGNLQSVSCQDAFANITAFHECWMTHANSVNSDRIFESCRRDYQDESPFCRTVRGMRMEVSPVTAGDRYQEYRAAVHDCSDLQPSSGFSSIRHTMLRKDLISSEVHDIDGVKCRCVSVPSLKNFIGQCPEDRRFYDDVYVPVEYFQDLPFGFGAPAADSDVSEVEAGDTDGGEKKPVRNPHDRFPDNLKSMYALCSIPDDAVIYQKDGQPSVMGHDEFSAKLTCLASDQLCYNNLSFDIARFWDMYDMAEKSQRGGAVFNRLEMMHDAPVVDFVENDGVLTPPDRAVIQDVYERSVAFSRERESRVSSLRPSANAESTNGPVSHRWQPSSRAGRDRIRDVTFSLLDSHRVNLVAQPIAEQISTTESFDPAAGHVEAPVEGAVDLSGETPMPPSEVEPIVPGTDTLVDADVPVFEGEDFEETEPLGEGEPEPSPSGRDMTEIDHALDTMGFEYMGVVPEGDELFDVFDGFGGG